MGAHFKDSDSTNNISATGSRANKQKTPSVTNLETLSQGFVPVMTENNGPYRGHNRLRKSEAHYRRTDPYDLKGRRDKSPKRRILRILGNIILFAAFILLLVAGGMLLYSKMRYQKQDEINQELAEFVETSEDGLSAPVVDWAALKAINADVVAWIQIPGTVINYPVYQGSDNEEYLHTDAKGEYSIGGQIFLDYENTSPGMVDGQSVVYGHHLLNGSMFKVIDDLENQELFNSITTVWYVTETDTYEMEPLFLYRAENDDETIRMFNFSSDEDYRTYLSGKLAASASSSPNASARITTVETVLSLCTCNYNSTNNGRSVLVCAVKE